MRRHLCTIYLSQKESKSTTTIRIRIQPIQTNPAVPSGVCAIGVLHGDVTPITMCSDHSASDMGEAGVQGWLRVRRKEICPVS